MSRRRTLGLLAALMVVASAVLLVTAARVWYVARQDERPRSDVIIVLGTAQYDGRPSAIFTARLEHALRLYEGEVAPAVMTVGGARAGDRFSEAEAAADYLAVNGVPREDLVVVGEGSNTQGSIEAAARVMEERRWESAVLVSDPWHILRSRTMARDEGIEAVGSPTRQGPAVYTRETQVRYIARETAALLYYELLGGDTG